MFGPFGMDPFAVTPHIQPHRAPRRPVIAATSATLHLRCKNLTALNGQFLTTLTLNDPF